MTKHPYDVSALQYLQGGLRPIPVRGKAPPPAGCTGATGSLTKDKLKAWLSSDLTVRESAGRTRYHNNVALVHKDTIAVDVDVYDGKDGRAMLEQLTQISNVSPLPDTYSSTSRGAQSPSRQYIYKLPAGFEGVRWATKPCDAVELCVWHHRYSVVAPSIHPTTRHPYVWYNPQGAPTTTPTKDQLTELPQEWVDLLSVKNVPHYATEVAPSTTPVTVDIDDLLSSFSQAPNPSALVKLRLAHWSDLDNHLGHDEAVKALINALLLGLEGHSGVHSLFALIVTRFNNYVQRKRPSQANYEVTALVEYAARSAVSIYTRKNVE